jgi:hypothetical protein
VHDALGVSSGQPIGDGRADLDHLSPRQWPLGQPATERFAFKQFHDGIGDGPLRAIVMDGEDVRVRQRRHGPRFALKACLPRRVMGV